MKKTFCILSVLAVALTALLSSCIEDGFTTSQSDQPLFSADTLKMGGTFTLEPTPTKKFTVHNPHGKMLSISSISLRDDVQGLFRLNVDGRSGTRFTNVEIRPNDSIFVFVEATLPENGTPGTATVEKHLDFVTNSVTKTVVLTLDGTDAVRLRRTTIASDTHFTAQRPYVIFDTLRVAGGATLTIDPGAHLYFHSEAAMVVEGRLVAVGTAEKPVQFTGDRTGNVAAAIPYELMSGQWGGVHFAASTPGDNRMEYVSMRNSSTGITLEPVTSRAGVPALSLINCQVRNTKGYTVASDHADLVIAGCELAEAAEGILWLNGGNHTVEQTTVANNYLFTALGGPAVQFGHFDAESDDQSGLPLMKATFANSVFHGLGTELSCGDFTGTDVTFRNCLFKSAGSDDDNFIGCLWDADPLFCTVRSEYLFDYRLQAESPAIGAADPALNRFAPTSDRYGVPYNSVPDLGAYVFVANEQ